MNDHTPAPWRAVAPKGRQPDYLSIIEGADGRMCAFTGAPTRSDGEITANGRLIAAAPDLLAAAQLALGTIEGLEGQTATRSIDGDMLRAAIAKAMAPVDAAAEPLRSEPKASEPVPSLPSPAEGGWRPIETADFDGSPALVYRPLARASHDEPVAIKRLIGGHHRCWAVTVPKGTKPFNPTDGLCHVTHFMPIPTPPKDETHG